jgi:uncharacterized protein with HEPN domain
MKKDPRGYLVQILERLERIVEFTEEGRMNSREARLFKMQ